MSRQESFSGSRGALGGRGRTQTPARVSWINARWAAVRTRGRGSQSWRAATTESASPTRCRATTFAAISLTRQESSASASMIAGVAASSQAHNNPRAPQTRNQYAGPPGWPVSTQLAGGPPRATTRSGSVGRPSSRAMHPSTTADSPRRPHSRATLWRGVGRALAAVTCSACQEWTTDGVLAWGPHVSPICSVAVRRSLVGGHAMEGTL